MCLCLKRSLPHHIVLYIGGIKLSVCLSVLPVGTADAPATRRLCVGNNEQNTTRLTDPSKSKQNNQTNIMYLNDRSLKSVTTNVNKVRVFSALIKLSQSDIYGITETWLNSNILDSGLFPERYILYRKDREHTVQHKRGGGILMAFKKEIISRRRADLEPDCEIMVCDMQVSNVKK